MKDRETFLDAVNSLQVTLIEGVDKMILDFFGSIEEAKKQAPSYIIDFQDPVFEVTGLDQSMVSCKMTAETILRKRTPEEMEL